jgi:hypothetical protein
LMKRSLNIGSTWQRPLHWPNGFEPFG